ncbi:MAG: hypothetical protein FGM47_00020 [Candidatus Nanopelagicaceae bacterium]|nr:hypothetical protein [Candidatus Nanopelagicaceae bacterium]
MANDLLSALRTYLSKVSSGEKTPQEMAAALNAWARESGESIKQRVEEEVARTVKKMGFAKQEELDRLAREVELLKSKLVVTPRNSTSSKKSTSTAKRSSAKKTANKAVKQNARKSPAKVIKKSGKK